MADKRIHKSGSQKRKIKEQKEDFKKKLPKLQQFFNVLPAKTASTSISKNDSDLPVEFDELKSTSVSKNDTELQSKSKLKSTCTSASQELEPPLADSAISVLHGNEDSLNINTATLDNQNKLSISTDLGDYKDKVISDEIKSQIISLPSSRPKGPFPKDHAQEYRSFNESFYFSASKYGPVPRHWLCYSSKLDAAFCEPCWLFSVSSNTWRTGIRDWRHLSVRIKEHSKSVAHVKACAVFTMWEKNATIDKDLENKVRFEASFWKMVLQRLFKITLALSKNALAFRAHRENVEDYNGNFLTMVRLLADYDDIMKQVLEMPVGSVRYLSPTIQNELISSLSDHLLNELVKEITLAPCYSLLLDTTQDISKSDQLSIIIRTVQLVRDKEMYVVDFKIKETFLGFYEITDHSASGMVTKVKAILKNLNIAINKCYGQGYDGASVMSGAYNGVQTKIKEFQKNAEYIHCASHNLNLVINDAVSGCTEVSSFFSILQKIYSFFGNSIKRWDLLASFTGESEISLKKLNPTRWAGRISSLLAVKLRFFEILKCLTEIILKSNKKDERDEAIS